MMKHGNPPAAWAGPYRRAHRTGACLLAAILALAIGVVAVAARPLVLFVAGEASHGPGEHRFEEGCALLAETLTRSGLDVRTAVTVGWPADDVLADAQALVLYSDGLERHVAAGHVAALRRHLAAGRGLVVLHFALEPGPGPLGELILDGVGGRFDAGWSVNPVWTLERPRMPSHEVTRGVEAIAVEDEWYFHLRFRAGTIPVLQALPPEHSLGDDGPRSGNPVVRAALARGELQTLAWVYEHEGRRGFGFTGGHFHRNWSEDSFRTLVLNGIAWTAGLNVPLSGARVSVAAATRYGTIEEAIARGDEADVLRHLALDPSRGRGSPRAALTPLHQAILRNRAEIALRLLEAGADPNQPDRSGRTPLHLATERGNARLVTALLERRARPNELDRIGWTPLHHAAAKNHVEVARALLAGGADPMTLSERGGTPLHEAAASGGVEMIRLLLDQGVDPSVVSKLGVTALEIAREFNNEPAIALLERLAPARRAEREPR